MCIAGLITFILCLAASFAFDKFIELPKYIFEIMKITIVGVTCLGLYTWLNLLFKMDYAKELFDRVYGKLKR